jgi:nucleoside-diphosphate-sugar epimerase
MPAMTEGGAMRELGPILAAVLAGRPVTGPIERPGPRGEYVYVKDAAQAAVLAVEAPAAAAGPYNVAGGLPVGRDAVLDAICDALPEARALMRRDYRAPAGGEPAREIPLATQRAEAALGYRARFGLAEGMRDLVVALRG